jgi:hypothetical protein
MLDEVTDKLEAIKSDPRSYERKLTAEAEKLIESRKAAGKAHEDILARSDVWIRQGMKPAAVAELQAWKQRKIEIEAAKRGELLAEPGE